MSSDPNITATEIARQAMEDEAAISAIPHRIISRWEFTYPAVPGSVHNTSRRTFMVQGQRLLNLYVVSIYTNHNPVMAYDDDADMWFVERKSMLHASIACGPLSEGWVSQVWGAMDEVAPERSASSVSMGVLSKIVRAGSYARYAGWVIGGEV